MAAPKSSSGIEVTAYDLSVKISVPIPACSSDDGTPDIDGVKSIIERRHKIVKIPIHLMPE